MPTISQLDSKASGKPKQLEVICGHTLCWKHSIILTSSLFLKFSRFLEYSNGNYVMTLGQFQSANSLAVQYMYCDCKISNFFWIRGLVGATY